MSWRRNIILFVSSWENDFHKGHSSLYFISLILGFLTENYGIIWNYKKYQSQDDLKKNFPLLKKINGKNEYNIYIYRYIMI